MIFVPFIKYTHLVHNISSTNCPAFLNSFLLLQDMTIQYATPYSNPTAHLLSFIFYSSIIIIIVITSLLFSNKLRLRRFVPEHLCFVVLECSLLRLQLCTSVVASFSAVAVFVAVDEDVEDQELRSTRPVAR